MKLSCIVRNVCLACCAAVAMCRIDGCSTTSKQQDSPRLSTEATVSCIYDIWRSFMLYKELSDISDHSDKENSSSDEDSASEYSSTSDEDDSLDLTDFLVEDMCYRYGKCYVDDEKISIFRDTCAKFKKYGVDTKEISECSDYLRGNKPIDLIRNPHCRVPIIVFSLGPAYSYELMYLVCGSTGLNSGYDEALSGYNYDWPKSNEGVCNVLLGMLKNVVNHETIGFSSVYTSLVCSALSDVLVGDAVSRVLDLWEDFFDSAIYREMRGL